MLRHTGRPNKPGGQYGQRAHRPDYGCFPSRRAPSPAPYGQRARPEGGLFDEPVALGVQRVAVHLHLGGYAGVEIALLLLFGTGHYFFLPSVRIGLISGWFRTDSGPAPKEDLLPYAWQDPRNAACIAIRTPGGSYESRSFRIDDEIGEITIDADGVCILLDGRNVVVYLDTEHPTVMVRSMGSLAVLVSEGKMRLVLSIAITPLYRDAAPPIMI